MRGKTPVTGKPGMYRRTHFFTGEVRPVSGVQPSPKADREKQKVEIQLSGNFQQEQSAAHAHHMHGPDAGPRREPPANNMALIYSFRRSTTRTR